MQLGRIAATIVTLGLCASAQADNVLKQGEGARLIKKAYPSITKIRGASPWGGQVVGIDRRGRVDLFSVDRETKQVTKLAGNLNRLIFAKVKSAYPAAVTGAKIAIGDAVGHTGDLTRLGSVRVGVSYPKGDPRKNFNTLVNVGKNPKLGLIVRTQADPSDGQP